MSQGNSAKFAFFYILSLVALAFVAISSGMIIFQIINKQIADIVNTYSASYSASAIKFAISAIVVSTPIYFLTARQIYKNLRTGQMSKDSGVRKWLTYLIILAAVLVMLGSLIAILNSFLGGELTTKFILKALTTLVIAGIIFFFYLFDIRRESVTSKNSNMAVFTYGGLVLIIIVFIASLFYVESPTQTRNRRIDERIVNNFAQIQSAIQSYYMENDKLPQNLDILMDDYNYITPDILQNPSDGQKVQYNIVEENKFELCTDFMTSNQDQQEPYKDYYAQEWPHKAGYDCISQKVQAAPDKVLDAVRQ